MASGDTLFYMDALNAQPPAADFGTLDLRNVTPVIVLKDTTTTTVELSGYMPANYGAGTITVTIGWMAADVTVGPNDCVLTCAWKSVTDDADDLDSKAFAAANTATSTEASASGEVKYQDIIFANGADSDSVAANEYFRLEIGREASQAADDLADDVQIVFVRGKEA